jgi:hypothetical protein
MYTLTNKAATTLEPKQLRFLKVDKTYSLLALRQP